MRALRRASADASIPAYSEAPRIAGRGAGKRAAKIFLSDVPQQSQRDSVMHFHEAGRAVLGRNHVDTEGGIALLHSMFRTIFCSVEKDHVPIDGDFNDQIIRMGRAKSNHAILQ